MDRLSRIALALGIVVAVGSSAVAQEFALGAAVYQAQCAPCHGELYYAGGPVYAEPGVVPAFYAGHRYLLNISPVNIRAAILFGVTGTGMNGLGGALSDDEVDSVIAYIESFRR